MYDVLIPLAPFLVAAAFVLWHALRRLDCPDCGTPLPPFVSPFRKTRRMWREGGNVCPRCGCETDADGRKVVSQLPPAGN